MTPNLYLPPDTYRALELYANAERSRMDNPVIQELITPKSIAQHILKNELVKRGYLCANGKVRE